jgi:hypothetical protein
VKAVVLDVRPSGASPVMETVSETTLAQGVRPGASHPVVQISGPDVREGGANRRKPTRHIDSTRVVLRK